MTINTNSTSNPEVPIPEAVEAQFDQTSEHWRSTVEWEAKRRELETVTDEEREHGEQLLAMIAQGLAGQLDDPDAFLDALEAVEALGQQRAETIASHLDDAPDDPCDPIAGPTELSRDG